MVLNPNRVLTSRTNASGPPEGDSRLAGIGVEAGITVIDCETRETTKSTANNLKSGIQWQQHRQKIIQFVNLWNRKSPFLQKGLEKLLSSLLTVKANFIVRWWMHAGQIFGDAEVALGLADPRRGEIFHTAPCPCR